MTLAPADVDRFANFVDALSRELADAAREHARGRGVLVRRPGRRPDLRGHPAPGRAFHDRRRVVEGPEAVAVAELVLPDGERVTVAPIPW